MCHWEGLLLYGLMQPTLVIFALVPSSLEADTGDLAITPGRELEKAIPGASKACTERGILPVN